MTWRRIAVYYLLSIVLGGYFLVSRPRSEGTLAGPTKRSTDQSARLLPFARDDIQELTLRSDEGAVTAHRTGQIWTVLSPAEAKVNSALVTSFVENLTADKEARIVAESPSDLAAYGLAPPYATVVIKGKNTDEVETVLIGNRNPTGSAIYARREKAPQVVLVGYSVRSYADLIFEGAGVGKK